MSVCRAGSKYIRAKGKGTPGQIEQGGVVIGSVASLLPAGISLFEAGAQKASEEWATVPAGRRAELLSALGDVCAAHVHELTEVTKAEDSEGRSEEEVERDVQAGIAVLRAGAAPSADIGGVATLEVRAARESWECIGPLAKGQACVLQCIGGPSSLLPLALRQCAEQAGLPNGMITVLTGRG